MAITERELAVLIQARLGNLIPATDAAAEALKKLGNAGAGAGAMAAGGMKLTQQHALNLQFQIQDIATMLASGQNPFTLIMQQGLQMVGIFGQAGIGSVGGALRATGAAFVSFLTNPLTLMVVGLAAASAAVSALFRRGREEGPTVEQTLERQRDLVREIRDAYSGAGDELRRYGLMSSQVALLEATRVLGELRTEVDETGQAIAEFFLDANNRLAGPNAMLLNGLGELIERFLVLRDQGRTAEGIHLVRDELANLLNTAGPLPAEFMVIVNRLYDLAQGGSEVAGRFRETEAIVRLLEAGVKDLTAALENGGKALENYGVKVETQIAAFQVQMADLARSAGAQFALPFDEAELEQQLDGMRKTAAALYTGDQLTEHLARIDEYGTAMLTDLRQRAADAAAPPRTSAGAAVTQPFTNDVEAARSATAAIEAELRHQRATYQITQQQELDALRLAKEEELRIVVATLEAQMNAAGVNANQRAKINADILEAQREHEEEMRRLVRQSVEEQAQLLEGRLNTAISSIRNAFRGVLEGTMTFREAIFQIIREMLIRWMDMLQKMVVENLVAQRAQTAATAAGVTQRTAIEVAGATASSAAERVGIIGRILGRAAEVYAKIYAWFAGLIGPGAAIPAAAARTQVASHAAIPSFDVGAWNIASDMIARVHSGEMIIPAKEASAIRSGEAGRGGPVIGELHFHAHGRLSKREIEGSANDLLDVLSTKLRDFGRPRGGRPVFGGV